MRDAGYIAAGYLVTAAAVATYAWSIRTRMRRVTRLLPENTPRSATVPSLGATEDREG